jgi:serine/threonine protein kinase
MSDIVRIDFEQSFESKSGNTYRNLQLLGTGGNASTFLVLATSGSFRGTPFALKVFRRLSKPERRDDFLSEIRFLRGCDHPSIMRVFDEGLYQRRHPFVVADYLPQTLRNVMGAVTTNVEKIGYSLQLLSALVYLDKLRPRVVHRDIKPENIFVKGRSCVLGDFGLMKGLPAGGAEDRERLKESIGPGMPFYYRTPDLVSYARGKSTITTKSDVWQWSSNPGPLGQAIRAHLGHLKIAND